MKDLVVYPVGTERQLRIMRYEQHARARRIKHYIAYSPIGETIIGQWASRALISISRLYVRTKYGIFIFLTNFYRNRWKFAFQLTLIAGAFYTYSQEKDQIHQVFQEKYAIVQSALDEQSQDGPYFQKVAYKSVDDSKDFMATLDDNNVQAYIKRFSRVAMTEMEKYGIPASIKMALAIIETQSSPSADLDQTNNHFGNAMSGPNYQSAWENWRAHTLMVKDQFPELFYLEPNSQQWATGLQKLEYSIDSNFAKKLLLIIDRYELNYLNEI